MDDNSIKDTIYGVLATIAAGITTIATYLRVNRRKRESLEINGNQVLTDGFRELGQQHKESLTVERQARMDAEARAKECEKEKNDLAKEKADLFRELAELRAEIRFLKKEMKDMREELALLKGEM